MSLDYLDFIELYEGIQNKDFLEKELEQNEDSGKRMFIIFNSKLKNKEKDVAFKKLQVNEFIYLPKELQERWNEMFLNEEVDNDFLDEIVKWVRNRGDFNDYVLIQGDYGATHYLVERFKEIGFIPIYLAKIYRGIGRNGSDPYNFQDIFFKKY